MTCENCGAPARPQGKRGPKRTHLVCSDNCRTRLSQKCNPERAAASAKAWYERNRDTVLRPKREKPCAACGSEFVGSQGQKNCHPCRGAVCGCGAGKAKGKVKCRMCANKDMRTTPLQNCEQCGVLYDTQGGDKVKYCSMDCFRAARPVDLTRRSQKRPSCLVYFPTCEGCGVQFTARTRGVKCCTSECEERAAELARAALPGMDRECIECGKVFHVSHGDMSRTCSGVCKQKRVRDALVRARRSRRARGMDDRGKHRKRAKRFGVAYEPVSRAYIMKRDGWMCKLCDKPIPRDVVVPHPKAGTLDHIVPISKGGPHTAANLQAAHFMCNSVKRDGGSGEQLLLVG